MSGVFFLVILYIIKKFKFVMAARYLSKTDSEELSSEYENLTSDCYEYLSNESERNTSDLDSQ